VRKWKEKLKEWRFDKYISASDMDIVVAKAAKRSRDEGKETIFFVGEAQILPDRIEQFKRRKTIKNIETMSPSAGTWKDPDTVYLDAS
jgi:phosphotransacetylase